MNNIIVLALRNLARNRRRTLIAMTTVSFGVAALIAAGGFVDALLVKLREDTIHSQLGHVQIKDAAYAESGLSAPYSHMLPAEASGMARIERLSGVLTVAPRLGVSGLVSVGETTLSFTGQGLDPSKEATLRSGLALTSGTWLASGDTRAAILGEGLASNLGVKPGDTVALVVTAANGTFNAMDVKVRGTFSSVSKAYDDIALRMPLSAAQQLLRVKGAQQWLVLLDDTDATERMLPRIREALPTGRYALTRWDEDADFYQKTSELFARQFGFVRVVVMIIIVLSILNATTMNVLERTWEIGVMLALGDRRRRILTLFALEGAILGVVSSGLGVAIGVALALVINAIGIPMPAAPGMSHGFSIGISLSTLLLAASFAIGAAATAAASLPPSLRASRLPIVDALRTGR